MANRRLGSRAELASFRSLPVPRTRVTALANPHVWAAGLEPSAARGGGRAGMPPAEPRRAGMPSSLTKRLARLADVDVQAGVHVERRQAGARPPSLARAAVGLASFQRSFQLAAREVAEAFFASSRIAW